MVSRLSGSRPWLSFVIRIFDRINPLRQSHLRLSISSLSVLCSSLSLLKSSSASIIAVLYSAQAVTAIAAEKQHANMMMLKNSNN